MIYTDGDVVVVAGSEKQVTFTIKDENGDARDLDAALSAQLRLQNIYDPGELITFRTNDDSPQLEFNSDRTSGELIFSPLASDFIEVATYRYQIWIYDVDKKYSVPDDGKQTAYQFKVESGILEEGSES